MLPNHIPDELADLLSLPDAVTNSVKLAELLGVRPHNILRVIEDGRIPELFKSYNIQQIKMRDSQGKLRKAYVISADGLIFILNSLTGKAANAWKLNLGEAIKRMQGIPSSTIHLVDEMVLDGTVYAAELATNKVKVGKAIDPYKRLATHFKSFGKATEILRTYVSDRHIEYSANELRTIQRFSRAGEEVFEGNFDEVVRYIENLPKTELTEDHSSTITSAANDRLIELLRLVQKVTKIPVLPN